MKNKPRKPAKANPRRRARRALKRNPRAARRPRAGSRAQARPRHRNPDSDFIGSAPTLWVSGQGPLQFPRGELRSAPDATGIYLDLGGSPAPRPGARVTRIDYDDPEKAVEAYKTIGRFRHNCEEPFIVGNAQGGSVLLTSKSTAWRKE